VPHSAGVAYEVWSAHVQGLDSKAQVKHSA
jgi:hypothetical protein